MRLRGLGTAIGKYWLVAVICCGIGILIGLAVRIPLLPSPNAFTTSLWTAMGGAAIGAGLTIAGTLHVTNALRQHDARMAVHTILDACYLLLSGLDELEGRLGPQGSYAAAAPGATPTKMLRQSEWEELHVRSQVCLENLERFALDLPACKAVARMLGPAVVRDVEQVNAMLARYRDCFQDLYDFAKHRKTQPQGAVGDATYKLVDGLRNRTRTLITSLQTSSGVSK